jgi:DNA-binding HxlR family transcriptional regulator
MYAVVIRLRARRVEYELSDLGRTLLGPIDELTRWAETYRAQVIDALDAGELEAA